MVKRILALLNRESGTVHEAALLLGFFTLLSQVLALIRDRSLAHFLGPSAHLDVYYAAFRIPDFLYVSIGSLVSITVLIPFLIKRMENGGEVNENKAKARIFMNQIFTAFFATIILLSGLIAILMPKIAPLIAPGFSANELAELVMMSRIMLLSPLFIGISNVLGTITQYYKNFFVYALSPVFYNIGIILGVIFLYPHFGIYGLAMGVILGAFLHFAIQIPVIVKHGFMPRITWKINWATVKEVAAVSLPRTLTLSLSSLSLIAIVALASMVKEGSISIFTFAYNLETVPLNIIGVSYSIAAFPILAQAFARGDVQRFIGHTISTARQIIFWSLPLMFLFIVIRAQIVRVILGSGRFSWSDTRLTAAALALFAISIVAQGLVLLFVRAYYAAGQTRRPLVVNLVSSAFTILFAFVLIRLYAVTPSMRYFFESLLRVDKTSDSTILMLPLAYSIGSLINFFALWFLFKSDFLRGKGTQLQKVFFQSLVAAFTLAIVAYAVLTLLGPLLGLSTFWGVFGQGLIAGVIGIVAAAYTLIAMGNPEIKNVLATLKHRLWGTASVSPGPEELA
jgi:putative peptidoglycan lipid II flippase